MPRVTVQMFEGRTMAQKRALVAKVTDAVVETCGVTAEHVTVVIDEMKKEHYAQGGKLIYAPEDVG
ncbi:MAG: 2-hydroxymuconate tautomerase family protein [Oscillospiraceae bacterium]|nr:2-hydroxymuconate tautomerase family protein [Oscillospiraceae bacterium]